MLPIFFGEPQQVLLGHLKHFFFFFPTSSCGANLGWFRTPGKWMRPKENSSPKGMDEDNQCWSEASCEFSIFASSKHFSHYRVYNAPQQMKSAVFLQVFPFHSTFLLVREPYSSSQIYVLYLWAPLLLAQVQKPWYKPLGYIHPCAYWEENNIFSSYICLLYKDI